MSKPRQIVREYIRACEQLLKPIDLSGQERHLLLEMTGRMVEMLLDLKEASRRNDG